MIKIYFLKNISLLRKNYQIKTKQDAQTSFEFPIKEVNMKKIAGLILILTMCICALTGCRNGSEPETTIPGGENLTPSSSMYPSTSSTRNTTNPMDGMTGNATDDTTGTRSTDNGAHRHQPRKHG